jgi:predicted transcriptional regulator
MGPYLPTPAPTLQYVAYQMCWVEGCEDEPRDMKAMTKHLQSKKHGMTLAETKAAIKDFADFDTVAGTHATQRKRAVTSKQIERQQGKAQKKTKTDE